MRRPAVLLGVWTLLLVVGFGGVIALGAPLATVEDRLESAMRPSPPVDEAKAIESAETIVAIKYPTMKGAQRTATRRTDFGVERWVVVYSFPDRLSLVRISITVQTGEVNESYLP
jgi:hypothetical protein